MALKSIICTILVTLFLDINIFINGETYGVDVSYPIHHYLDPTTYAGKRYTALMEGCYAQYDKESCDANEDSRLIMNLEQPSTQYNYTELGFKKMKIPSEVWEALNGFWQQHKDAPPNVEEWYLGNTITNHWESPMYMVSVENSSLAGAGPELKQTIWDGVKPVLEEWVGHKLIPTSMYGIRIYTDKSVLAPHVDRSPLVTSCIMNIDQDVDEPWPIEVYSHDGKAYNVTMEPGDMVLYESHTVIHGRPFPLKGKFFANIFVHFEPIDHKEMSEPFTGNITEYKYYKDGDEEYDYEEQEGEEGVAEPVDGYYDIAGDVEGEVEGEEWVDVEGSLETGYDEFIETEEGGEGEGEYEGAEYLELTEEEESEENHSEEL
eukprot:gene3565-7091_t